MTDDTISRVAALAEVMCLCEECPVQYYIGPCPSQQCDVRIMREALESLPPAQPGWIPVTEKCPEIGQIVLCSLKTRHYYGRIHVCRYCAADKYYDHPYFNWDHNGFPDVVAWMPLPAPYIPEGDDKHEG